MGDEGYWLYIQDRTINPEKMEGLKLCSAPGAHIWNRNKGDEEYWLYIQDRTINPEKMEVFSSSKFTSTPERNRLYVENMEFLQVLKHALRRCRRDAMAGIATPTD
ncbi:hypothetical protein RSAG8_13696, partial [Rhizoctonia solani AG-8 WAC10335]